ncbi:hypothetical protein E2C01_068340 [Portunus trituberculatus]|uniref:Uncharacterized protein n=1 Tax=Portunus trituberculatus TaxID=210409 RepID=A0A5B7HW82_PORTR|nr:hypothetical protein [Portunus trituberculatus]
MWEGVLTTFRRRVQRVTRPDAQKTIYVITGPPTFPIGSLWPNIAERQQAIITTVTPSHTQSGVTASMLHATRILME